MATRSCQTRRQQGHIAGGTGEEYNNPGDYYSVALMIITSHVPSVYKITVISVNKYNTSDS